MGALGTFNAAEHRENELSAPSGEEIGGWLGHWGAGEGVVPSFGEFVDANFAVAVQIEFVEDVVDILPAWQQHGRIRMGIITAEESPKKSKVAQRRKHLCFIDYAR